LNLIPKSHLAITAAPSKITVSGDSNPREACKLWD